MAADERLQHLRDTVDDPVGWAFFAGVALTQAGRASLLLRDRGTPQFLVYAAVGMEASEAASLRVSPGKGVAGVVAERGLILAGEDAGTVFLSVPVVTAHGVEGVLEVADRQGGRQYDDGDIALVEAIAAHIAYHLGREQVAPNQAIASVAGRTLFEDLLDRELARSRRTGSPLTVAIAQIVGRENSVVGVDDDHVLEAISDALRGALRRYDVVGQYSHDSVALLFISANDAGLEVMQRVTDTVAGVLRDIGPDVECRIGMARCPVDGISGAELLAVAGANAMRGERVESISS